MPETPKQLKVFLCHSSQDKPVVREIYKKLGAEGWIDPWLDEKKLLPGQDWNMEIEKAVETSHIVLVFLTNNSVSKEGYVQRELRMVLDAALNKPEDSLFVIPVKLEECQIPRRLQSWQWLNYFPLEERPDACERLLSSLKIRASRFGIPISTKSNKRQKPASITRIAALQPAISSPTLEAAGLDLYIPPGYAEALVASPPAKVKTWIFAGIEFVKVPAGKFLMGSSDEDEQAPSNEKPQHNVNIPYDYFIARYPITNEQFFPFTQAIGINHSAGNLQSLKKSNHPVVDVSWKNAITYCRWLNDLRTTQLPAGLIMRLPTEAEWEKAARWRLTIPTGEDKSDGESLIYPWGDSFDKDRCNTKEGGNGGTVPVGLYSPAGDSPYGCADMSGNVWEWTHTLFKKYPYQVNDDREVESTVVKHVLRGGSFRDNNKYARCATRRVIPFVSVNGIYGGIRLVVAPSFL